MKFICSEFSQTCSISTPFSFLLSIELYILTNTYSINTPTISLLFKRLNTLLSSTNTYTLIYYSLVFITLFIQIKQLEDFGRIIFLFKYNMMMNPTSVLQFVFLSVYSIKSSIKQ